MLFKLSKQETEVKPLSFDLTPNQRNLFKFLTWDDKLYVLYSRWMWWDVLKKLWDVAQDCVELKRCRMV